MFLRQVPRHEVQRHGLRQVRCEGYSQPRASQAHGPHQPCCSGCAHLVFQGYAQPLGYPFGHENQPTGKGDLLPGLCGN